MGRLVRRSLRWACVVGVALLLIDALLYGRDRGYVVGYGWYQFLTRSQPKVDQNPALADHPCARVVWSGDIENRELTESSGLTASQQHADVLWSINDSGNEPALYAMTVAGDDLGRWPVAGPLPGSGDWEALDAVTIADKHYLIVGDVGDNFGIRGAVHLIWVEEPHDLSDPQPLKLLGVQSIRYPEGPRDAEAMAVDVANDRILLLSKREYPPQLFAVPLAVEEGAADVQAQSRWVHCAAYRSLYRQTMT